MQQIISERITREFDDKGKVVREIVEKFYAQEAPTFQDINHTGDYVEKRNDCTNPYEDIIFFHPPDTSFCTLIDGKVFTTVTNTTDIGPSHTVTGCTLEGLWNDKCGCKKDTQKTT